MEPPLTDRPKCEEIADVVLVLALDKRPFMGVGRLREMVAYGSSTEVRKNKVTKVNCGILRLLNSFKYQHRVYAKYPHLFISILEPLPKPRLDKDWSFSEGQSPSPLK